MSGQNHSDRGPDRASSRAATAVGPANDVVFSGKPLAGVSLCFQANCYLTYRPPAMFHNDLG